MDKINSSAIQVKIFRSMYSNDLEKEINKFLEESNVIVHDIKFSSSQAALECFQENYTFIEVLIIFSSL